MTEREEDILHQIYYQAELIRQRLGRRIIVEWGNVVGGVFGSGYQLIKEPLLPEVREALKNISINGGGYPARVTFGVEVDQVKVPVLGPGKKAWYPPWLPPLQPPYPVPPIPIREACIICQGAVMLA